MALTTNPAEFTCYLDVRDGAVQMLPIGGFDEDDDWPSEQEIDAGLAAAHLIHVEPLGSSVEYGWMADFVGTLGNARLRDLLGSRPRRPRCLPPVQGCAPALPGRAGGVVRVPGQTCACRGVGLAGGEGHQPDNRAAAPPDHMTAVRSWFMSSRAPGGCGLDAGAGGLPLILR